RPNLSSNGSGIRLWLLLWKATKGVETQAHRSVRATGLCLSDFGVLEALLHKGPLPVSALGKKVLLTSGSMTAAVDRLERRGWVERRFTASDRRSRIVCLTAQGAKLIRQDRKSTRLNSSHLVISYAVFCLKKKKKKK